MATKICASLKNDCISKHNIPFDKKNHPVQIEELKKLRSDGHSSAVISSLIGLLKEDIWNVRENAVWVIREVFYGDLPSGEAGELYENLVHYLLKDDSWEVRIACTEALKALGTKGNVDVLMGLLEAFKQDEEWTVRESVATTICELSPQGDTSIIESFLEFGADSRWRVRLEMAKSLKVLVLKGDKRAISVLLTLLNDESWLVTKESLESLAVISTRGDVEVMKATLPLIKHSKSRIRMAACIVLKEVVATNGDKKVTENEAIITALVRVLKKESKWEVKVSIINTLKIACEKGNKKIIKLVLNYLEDDSEEVQESACNFLKGICSIRDQLLDMDYKKMVSNVDKIKWY